MRLNLLPKHASQGSRWKGFFIAGLAMVALSILAAVFMIKKSNTDVTDAQARLDQEKPRAEAALKEAQKAETVAALGTEIQRNLDLKSSMDAQNSKYTRMYRFVMDYIPPYYRINNMSITPIDDKNFRLNLTGVLQTFQQHADLSIALLRLPGAQSVARGAFDINDIFIPNLSEDDQVALPHLLKNGRKPPMVNSGPNSGPDAQLAYLQSLAQQGATGFTGVGGFGTKDATLRHAMPEWSEVTYQVLMSMDDKLKASDPAMKDMSYDFRAPNAKTTLATQAAAATTATPDATQQPTPGPKSDGDPTVGK